MSYCSKYNTNKKMYININHLINQSTMTGGNILSMDQLIINDLKQINKNVSSKKYMKRKQTRTSTRSRDESKKRPKKRLISRNTLESEDQTKKEETTNKSQLYNKPTFTLIKNSVDFKNKLPDITLKGKYLKKYETTITSNLYQQELSDLGFYEYVFKLLQHLNECGLNRTRQLYGTCWLNTVLNCIIFGKNLRNKFIQLMGTHKKNDSEFIENLEKTSETIYNIGTKIERNENLIFKYILNILYKLLCDEGLRNKDPTKYENFSLTNLAMSLRSLPYESLENLHTVDTVEEMIQKDNLHYSVELAFDKIIDIFNKNVSSKNHIIFDDNQGSKIHINNTEHINVLFFYIYKMGHVLMSHSSHNDKVVFIKNVKVNMINGIFDKQYLFKGEYQGYNISNIDNIEFILLSLDDDSHKYISDEIKCTVNDKETVFKLECGAISYTAETENYTTSHAMTGFICENEYYIYESFFDIYFKIDWRNLNTENYKELIYILYPDVVLKSFIIKMDVGIYYNTNINFSYNLEGCRPHRPDIME